VKKYTLVTLVLFYITARLVVLFFSPYLYDPEESYRGSVAKEILDGSRFNLFELQYEPHEGGSLLVSVVAALFFKIFGISTISLKLVALSFSTLTLVLLFFFMKDYFGEKIAAIAAVLLTLAPPFYAVFNLVTLGDYTEASFAMAILYLFFKIVHSGKRGPLWLAAFGFLCGFSIWFSYANLVIAAACFAYWLLLDRHFFLKRGFAVVLLFVLVGLSPWFYYNFTHSFAGLNKLCGAFESSHSIIEKLKVMRANFRDLSPHIMPAAFRFFDMRIHIPGITNFVLSRKALAFTYYGAFIISFVRLCSRNRNLFGREFFIIFYIFFFSAVYILTDYANSPGERIPLGWGVNPGCVHTTGYGRFIFLLEPFIVMTLAITTGNMLSKNGPRYLRTLGAASLTVLIFVGMAGNAGLLAAADTSVKRSGLKPYNLPAFFAYLGSGSRNENSDPIKKILPKLKDEEKPYFYFGMGAEAICGGTDNPYCEGQPYLLKRGNKIIDIDAVVEEKFRHYYFAGVGYGFCILCKAKGIEESLAMAGRLRGRDREYATAAVLQNEMMKNNGRMDEGYSRILDKLGPQGRIKEIMDFVQSAPQKKIFEPYE